MDEFRQYLETNGKSKNTIDSYLTAVKKYSEWFMSRYDYQPTCLYAENIAEFKFYLSSQDVSASTFNSRLAGLRAWNVFLIAKNVQSDHVIQKDDNKKIQRQYASPAIHTEKDVNRFIQAVLEKGSKRDYALVNLLAYTGLRISEALNLQIKHIHFESRELEVIDGKGDKTRSVFLSDKVVRNISKYLKKERHKYRLAETSPYLFLSNRNQQLSRITVYKASDNYSQIAGINPPITPHDFRHFFCSNALEKGFDVHEVASMAGHSNIDITLLYTHPGRKKMLEKINRLSNHNAP